MRTDPRNVSVIQEISARYPSNKPYHPNLGYPEYLFKEFSDEPNKVYDMVRQSFLTLGLDAENVGKVSWNPLGKFIVKGNSVFIKPNLIAPSVKYDPNIWEHVITHGSMIRSVVDYVYIALEGKGRVIIGDGPQTDSDVSLILERTGITSIREFYRRVLNFEIEFIDLRNEYWVNDGGIVVDKIKLNGDPQGTIQFDLRENSFFSELDHLERKYYGAYYDIEETNRHHSNGRHEYLISRTPIDCDVFINLPKLKTHKKVGVTLNLKSLVGINGEKNWLPHYAIGSPENHGDQFNKLRIKEKVENLLVVSAKNILKHENKLFQFMAKQSRGIGYKIFGDTEKVVRSGNWYGNDTCWRMSLDLNKLLIYGNPDGTFRDRTYRKKYLSVVDGVTAMEGSGPAGGTAVNAGLVFAGIEPLNVDLTAAKIIGFDYKKIQLLKRSFDKSALPIFNNEYKEIRVLSNVQAFNKLLEQIKVSDCFHFEPHFAWKGQIEL